MKPIYKDYKLTKTGKVLNIPFVSMLRAADGSVAINGIDVDYLDCMRVFVERPDLTGVVVVNQNVMLTTHYVVNGDTITLYVGGLPVGESRVKVCAVYGTNTQAIFVARLLVPVGAPEGYDDAETVNVPPVNSVGGFGGGADYKTDKYFDADGRLLVERAEDGSTTIFDEHENAIVKRRADGTTEYYDAYQSARLMISEHGDVSLNYTEEETVKTLKLAEAILARTKKRLLTNAVGEETIKDEQGNILTHEQIYAMLMNTPDFVVLVRADHAFHPNLVTPTQIAFTCSYLGADGQISAERVNITDENVVSYTSGKGVTFNSSGGVVIAIRNSSAEEGALSVGRNCRASRWAMANGDGCLANGECSHAEGEGCIANGSRSHAEGDVTTASGSRSHAEGTRCEAYGGTSHVEGNYCVTGENGGSAHAEGSYTNANGAASHTEGYRTTTTAGGQHAQGCWNAEVAEEFAFMHGCGSDASDKKNAFLIVGQAIYVIGIGGYDGTNHTAEGVQSLQEVLLS